ncbi:hypothetical protein [Thermomonospora umbrina]|uniref:hypothetical protein n=1 Tax=Thermomonospora umbrina TaxID=111806 RepID=UPI000E252029|nr:hypothetical protein [Thermomonospora umbrina]
MDGETLQVTVQRWAEELPTVTLEHPNKRHWITLASDDSLDGPLSEDPVTDSYRLVVEGLPQPRRPVDPGAFGRPHGDRVRR